MVCDTAAFLNPMSLDMLMIQQCGVNRSDPFHSHQQAVLEVGSTLPTRFFEQNCTSHKIAGESRCGKAPHIHPLLLILLQPPCFSGLSARF